MYLKAYDTIYEIAGVSTRDGMIRAENFRSAYRVDGSPKPHDQWVGFSGAFPLESPIADWPDLLFDSESDDECYCADESCSDCTVGDYPEDEYAVDITLSPDTLSLLFDLPLDFPGDEEIEHNLLVSETEGCTGEKEEDATFSLTLAYANALCTLEDIALDEGAADESRVAAASGLMSGLLAIGF